MTHYIIEFSFYLLQLQIEGWVMWSSLMKTLIQKRSLWLAHKIKICWDGLQTANSHANNPLQELDKQSLGKSIYEKNILDWMKHEVVLNGNK